MRNPDERAPEPTEPPGQLQGEVARFRLRRGGSVDMDGEAPNTVLLQSQSMVSR